jgi:hypothetical protein
MDGFHFDALARSLTTAGSRRRALTGLLLGSLGLLDARAEAAKSCKKIKNKQKRKKCRAKARCVPRCAGKPCGSDDGCGGVCGCGAGLTCCSGTCVDRVTDPAHCGSCGRSCPSGGCIHGACACAEETQCPSAACDCFKRLHGPPHACAPNVTETPCDEDADCALGSACTVGGVCSVPCGG